MTTAHSRRLILLGGAVAVLIVLAVALAVWRPWVAEAQDTPCSVLDELAFSLDSALASGVIDSSGLSGMTDRLDNLPGYVDDPLGLRVSAAVGEVLAAEPEQVAPAADAALDAVAVAQVDQDCGVTP